MTEPLRDGTTSRTDQGITEVLRVVGGQVTERVRLKDSRVIESHETMTAGPVRCPYQGCRSGWHVWISSETPPTEEDCPDHDSNRLMGAPPHGRPRTLGGPRGYQAELRNFDADALARRGSAHLGMLARLIGYEGD